MNVVCFINEVDYYLKNNTAFQTFCNADSTSVSEHIFKYSDAGAEIYPCAIIANGPQSVIFEGDLISGWAIDIVVKIFDIKDRYVNEENQPIENNGEILYEFMYNCDQVIKEMCTLYGIPIKTIDLISGPSFEEEEVRNQGEGQLISITYKFAFEPGGN